MKSLSPLWLLVALVVLGGCCPEGFEASSVMYYRACIADFGSNTDCTELGKNYRIEGGCVIGETGEGVCGGLEIESYRKTSCF